MAARSVLRTTAELEEGEKLGALGIWSADAQPTPQTSDSASGDGMNRAERDERQGQRAIATLSNYDPRQLGITYDIDPDAFFHRGSFKRETEHGPEQKGTSIDSGSKEGLEARLADMSTTAYPADQNTMSDRPRGRARQDEEENSCSGECAGCSETESEAARMEAHLARLHVSKPSVTEWHNRIGGDTPIASSRLPCALHSGPETQQPMRSKQSGVSTETMRNGTVSWRLKGVVNRCRTESLVRPETVVRLERYLGEIEKMILGAGRDRMDGHAPYTGFGRSLQPRADEPYQDRLDNILYCVGQSPRATVNGSPANSIINDLMSIRECRTAARQQYAGEA